MFHIYIIFCMLKIEELGVESFRKFVLIQKPHNMKLLLTFIWDSQSLAPHGWMEDQLSRIFDITHVREVMIAALKKVQPEINELLEELEVKLAKGDNKKGFHLEEHEKQYTVCQPFNLSSPSKKLEKPKTPIYKTDIKAKPVPSGLYRNSLDTIERMKAERRSEIHAGAQKAQQEAKPVRLHVMERPSNMGKLLAADAIAFQKLTSPTAAKPMPNFSVSPSVRRTAAQVLRDEAMFRKEDDAAAAELLRFEMELRDSSELDKYRKAMDAQDAAQRVETIQQRKKDMVESHVRAAEAQANKLIENAEQAKAMRADLDKELGEREKENSAAVEAKRAAAEEIKKQEARVADVVEKVKKQKHDDFTQEVKEREARKARMAKEAAQELQKRK